MQSELDAECIHFFDHMDDIPLFAICLTIGDLPNAVYKFWSLVKSSLLFAILNHKSQKNKFVISVRCFLGKARSHLAQSEGNGGFCDVL